MARFTRLSRLTAGFTRPGRPSVGFTRGPAMGPLPAGAQKGPAFVDRAFRARVPGAAYLIRAGPCRTLTIRRSESGPESPGRLPAAAACLSVGRKPVPVRFACRLRRRSRIAKRGRSPTPNPAWYQPSRVGSRESMPKPPGIEHFDPCRRDRFRLPTVERGGPP